jgi:hypothetical protein
MRQMRSPNPSPKGGYHDNSYAPQNIQHSTQQTPRLRTNPLRIFFKLYFKGSTPLRYICRVPIEPIPVLARVEFPPTRYSFNTKVKMSGSKSNHSKAKGGKRGKKDKKEKDTGKNQSGNSLEVANNNAINPAESIGKYEVPVSRTSCSNFNEVALLLTLYITEYILSRAHNCTSGSHRILSTILR